MTGLQLVGTTSFTNPSPSVEPLVDWPPGTMAGDFAVLALTTGQTVVGTVFTHDHEVLIEIIGQPQNAHFYHALLPSDFTPTEYPIEVAWEGGIPGSSFHFLYESANLAVYRNVAAVTDILIDEPTDPFIRPYEYPGGAAVGGPHPHDDVFAEAAVVSVWERSATVTGIPSPDLTGVWTQDTDIGRRMSSTINRWSSSGLLALVPPGEFLMPGTDPIWGSVTYAVDLDVRRATRQYPRDDTLGLGSAPRIHPPPRARRIVGGYL